MHPSNGQISVDQDAHRLGFESDLLVSSLVTANTNLACSEITQVTPDIDFFDKYLDEVQHNARENPLLKNVFAGFNFKVILPQIVEEDPGLYFEEIVLEASQRLKTKRKVSFEIKYGSDVPIAFRLTPTPKSGHQELLEKLTHNDLPGWFIPSTIGCNLAYLLGIITQMPSNVSLLGFNDGWPVVIQNMKLFQRLCIDRAFWLTGINSETSGVGFCIETNSLGNLILHRRPYTEMQSDDIHGLLIT